MIHTRLSLRNSLSPTSATGGKSPAKSETYRRIEDAYKQAREEQKTKFQMLINSRNPVSPTPPTPNPTELSKNQQKLKKEYQAKVTRNKTLLLKLLDAYTLHNPSGCYNLSGSLENKEKIKKLAELREEQKGLIGPLSNWTPPRPTTKCGESQGFGSSVPRTMPIKA